MAHEVETMAYANALPWHGLGAKVSDDLSADQFLVAAGLDWEVKMHPLVAQVGDELVKVPNKFALIRDKDNKVMTVASSSWNPVQNRELIGTMDKYVTAGGAKLETAGSLRDGSVIWGLANLGHEFEVRKGDKVKGFLLITGSHTVGTATKIRTTTVRVVCANTLAMAERSTNQVHFSQNHLKPFDMAKAQESIEKAHEELAACERRFKTIAALKLGVDDMLTKVLAPIFAAEAKEEDVLSDPTRPAWLKDILVSYSSAPGHEMGTGWGALNAVTHWADHKLGHSNESRTFRSWMGDIGRKKLEVEAKLLELAA
jgi:phage/plasmid-like protein (TIGR03299 family)